MITRLILMFKMTDRRMTTSTFGISSQAWIKMRVTVRTCAAINGRKTAQYLLTYYRSRI